MKHHINEIEMKPYSLEELREKIVSAIEKGKNSFRTTAEQFCVIKSGVQKLAAQKRNEGHVIPVNRAVQ
jgi:transposase